MRLISTKALKEDMIIGRAICNEANRPLIQQHVAVNAKLIQRLNDLNIQYVYIDDSISEGIEIEEVVPRETRKKAIDSITTSFKAIRDMKNSKASFLLDRQSKQLYSIVDSLLETITKNEEVMTVLSDAFIVDEYLYQHSFQVAIYSIAIAKELGYSENEIRQIGLGAILHDVGKMLIPQEILIKPGKLSDTEFESMKQHTIFGFDILRNLHTISLLVAHCAFQHHERLNGSGYPRGIQSDDIHPYAKIIAVADVFDAVTSNRVYRSKMLPSEGFAIISEGSGTLFDSRVVNALQKTIAHYPNGTIVLLSDGRRGIVSKQNMHCSDRPWIRIFEEQGQILKATYEVNLHMDSSIFIHQIDVDYNPNKA